MVQPSGSREALSKALFNAQHRLSVAAVVRTVDGPLRREDVMAKAGVSSSVAHKELAVLAAIGAVQRVELDRSVYFQRIESAYWALSEELDALVADQYGTHTAASGRSEAAQRP